MGLVSKQEHHQKNNSYNLVYHILKMINNDFYPFYLSLYLNIPPNIFYKIFHY